MSLTFLVFIVLWFFCKLQEETNEKLEEIRQDAQDRADAQEYDESEEGILDQLASEGLIDGDGHWRAMQDIKKRKQG